ncbi:hypothetical protein DIPPA_50787 [Diplonema papillatum]|nr:hypothetical protein DIPPA_50787 [Diplonema papillatum]
MAKRAAEPFFGESRPKQAGQDPRWAQLLCRLGQACAQRCRTCRSRRHSSLGCRSAENGSTQRQHVLCALFGLVWHRLRENVVLIARQLSSTLRLARTGI